MRVTLDTNVIVSALLSPRGAPADVVQQWEQGVIEVATSPALVTKLERVLSYDKIQQRLKLSEEALDTFVEQFRTMTLYVEPEQEVQVIAQDPDDNRVLECAIAAGSAYIVSGDTHLLGLKEYEGIVILDPNAFMALLSVGE